MSAISIKRLIDDYLRAVEHGVSLLKQEFKAEDLLAAWLRRDIPKEGTLSDGLRFKFHGVGCFLIYEDMDVNFDFGPKGRSDGFDAWRLWEYSSQCAEQYPEFRSENAVKKALDDLIVEGTVVSPNWEPSRHLLYYTSSVLERGDEA